MSEIELKLINLEFSKYILKKNYEELMKAILFYEEEGHNMLDFENPEKGLIYQQEIIRTLQNYLSAKESLVEHTRRLIEKLNEPSFAEELEKRKSLKLLNGVTLYAVSYFLTGLRNKGVHIELIFPRVRHTFDLIPGTNKGEGKTEIQLEKGKLREILKGESSNCTKYLNIKKGTTFSYTLKYPDSKKEKKTDEHMPLKEIIQEYQILIELYYKWFDEKKRKPLKKNQQQN